MAIGDGENDIEMLRLSGVGAASFHRVFFSLL